MFGWFGPKEEPNALTGNSAFITLAQLARQNDDDVGRLIRGLVNKPSAERVLLVERVASQLEAGGAGRELVQALRFLSHDEVAERLKALAR